MDTISRALLPILSLSLLLALSLAAGALIRLDRLASRLEQVQGDLRQEGVNCNQLQTVNRR